MYQVPDDDRKTFLEYISKKPYLEAAPLITRLAAWKREANKPKENNGKDKTN